MKRVARAPGGQRRTDQSLLLRGGGGRAGEEYRDAKDGLDSQELRAIINVTFNANAAGSYWKAKEKPEMKKRIAIIGSTILVAAALVAAPVVFAQMHARHAGGHGFGAGHMGMFGMMEHFQKLRDELDLSNEQVGQIHGIFKDLHEQNDAYRDQLHGALKDVAKTLIANPNDVAGAQAKLDAELNAENAMKTNALNAASKALAVLTPQQRTKLATMLDEHFQKMESRGK